MRTFLVIPLIIAVLAGCANNTHRRLHAAEKAYDTDGSITSLFHSTLYYPRELSLRFDGFIVGIEKSPREMISNVGDIQIRPVPEAGLDDKAARKRLNDGKMMFVSHIVKNEAQLSKTGNCAVYNVYDIRDTKPTIPVCDKPVLTGMDRPVRMERANREDTRTAFRDSWEALRKLEDAIAAAVATKKYTHVVVVTMGWNTDQIEAIRNINSIASNMVFSSPTQMNPLVIGVTWPSMWVSDWFDPVLKLASFPYKAADADELGVTWLGVLLHQTLPAAQSTLPLVVVGHSFGSRATMMASCVGPVIYEKDMALKRQPIPTVINFQGAFLTSHLLAPKTDNFRFPDRCSNVANIVLTSSAADKANKLPFWGEYAGDEKSFAMYCGSGPQAGKIRCAHATETGTLGNHSGNSTSNILFVNADHLIKERAYASGGGAHSDIYRHEHRQLINDIINRKSSP